jgi:hypothetical protein
LAAKNQAVEQPCLNVAMAKVYPSIRIATLGRRGPAPLVLGSGQWREADKYQE